MAWRKTFTKFRMEFANFMFACERRHLVQRPRKPLPALHPMDISNEENRSRTEPQKQWKLKTIN